MTPTPPLNAPFALARTPMYDAQGNMTRPWVLYFAARNAAEATLASEVAAIAALTPVFTPETQNFVFEGDSLTAGSALPAGQDYPAAAMLESEFAGRGTGTNVGIGGSTLANIVSRYAANVYPLRPLGAVQSSILFVWIGINDSATWGASVNAPSEYVASLQAYWAQAKADGFTIVAFTMGPAAFASAPALNTLRIEVNILIKASLGWDALIPIDEIFPDFSSFLTTGSTISGNPVITVASAVGIGIGQQVAGAGISTGPYPYVGLANVTGISGLNITISPAPTATGGPVNIYFMLVFLPDGLHMTYLANQILARYLNNARKAGGALAWTSGSPISFINTSITATAAFSSETNTYLAAFSGSTALDAMHESSDGTNNWFAGINGNFSTDGAYRIVLQGLGPALSLNLAGLLTVAFGGINTAKGISVIAATSDYTTMSTTATNQDAMFRCTDGTNTWYAGLNGGANTDGAYRVVLQGVGALATLSTLGLLTVPSVAVGGLTVGQVVVTTTGGLLTTAPGFTGGIVTAKLTLAGANGSMAFTNGLLTSQVQAT